MYRGFSFPRFQKRITLSRERLLTTPDPRLEIPRAFVVYQRSSFVGLVMLEVEIWFELSSLSFHVWFLALLMHFLVSVLFLAECHLPQPDTTVIYIYAHIMLQKEQLWCLCDNCCCMKTQFRQVGITWPSKVYRTCSKHIFKCLNGSLSLTIHMWVVGSAHVELCSHRFLKRLPKAWSESTISIWAYRYWYSMESHDFLDVDSHQSFHPVWFLYWQEMSGLCQPIDYYPYGIQSICCLG